MFNTKSTTTLAHKITTHWVELQYEQWFQIKQLHEAFEFLTTLATPAYPLINLISKLIQDE
jgi:hypothetical protein